MSFMLLVGAAAAYGFLFVATARGIDPAGRATTSPAVAAAPAPYEGAGMKDIKIKLIQTNRVGNAVRSSFNVINDNHYAVRNPVISCTHIWNSGAATGHSTFTLYEIIPADGGTTISNFDLGGADQQTTAVRCGVFGFTRA